MILGYCVLKKYYKSDMSVITEAEPLQRSYSAALNNAKHFRSRLNRNWRVFVATVNLDNEKEFTE